MNKLYSVHDHWTDINKKNDVDIESIDGVITGIKVNGEDYGGGGGSSDFSTAKVTINATETPVVQGAIYDFVCIDEKSNITVLESINYDDALNDKPIVETILYQGKYIIHGNGINSVQGSATMVQNEDLFIITITGDCTITIS